MGWIRARSPEQKEQRRVALLEAAAALFAELDFDRVSLKAIARQAGVCKTNVYRYFESKEAIFFQLLQEDLGEWIAAVERALAPLAGSNDADAVARELARSLADRPRLAALMAVAVTVLERNLTVEAIVEAKREWIEASLRLVNALHAAVPALSVERCRELLLYTHLLLGGLWPAAHPSPALAEALQRPELQEFCVDFDRELEAALRTLLRGLLAGEG